MFWPNPTAGYQPDIKAFRTPDIMSCHPLVKIQFKARLLAVSNVLTALIFSNSRNFEMERDTTRELKPNW